MAVWDGEEENDAMDASLKALIHVRMVVEGDI